MKDLPVEYRNQFFAKAQAYQEAYARYKAEQDANPLNSHPSEQDRIDFIRKKVAEREAQASG